MAQTFGMAFEPVHQGRSGPAGHRIDNGGFAEDVRGDIGDRTWLVTQEEMLHRKVYLVAFRLNVALNVRGSCQYIRPCACDRFFSMRLFIRVGVHNLVSSQENKRSLQCH